MLIILVLAAVGFGIAYQVEKPCDDKCFQEKISGKKEQEDKYNHFLERP